MIFVDTSFWIAFRDERDVNHARAKELMTDFFRTRTQLAITDHIFAETHAYFVRSVAKRRQIMRDLLENPVVRHFHIEPQDRKLALLWLHEYDVKAWSFVDALSFALIQRQSLRAAASFDQHFGQLAHFEQIF